jgi:hypothetical protein
MSNESNDRTLTTRTNSPANGSPRATPINRLNAYSQRLNSRSAESRLVCSTARNEVECCPSPPRCPSWPATSPGHTRNPRARKSRPTHNLASPCLLCVLRVLRDTPFVPLVTPPSCPSCFPPRHQQFLRARGYCFQEKKVHQNNIPPPTKWDSAPLWAPERTIPGRTPSRNALFRASCPTGLVRAPRCITKQ